MLCRYDSYKLNTARYRCKVAVCISLTGSVHRCYVRLAVLRITSGCLSQVRQEQLGSLITEAIIGTRVVYTHARARALWGLAAVHSRLFLLNYFLTTSQIKQYSFKQIVGSDRLAITLLAVSVSCLLKYHFLHIIYYTQYIYRVINMQMYVISHLWHQHIASCII